MTATGTVNPVTTVQVGTYVSGPILAIDVDFNSPVKKGQRVAKIDPRAVRGEGAQAEANVANARASVAQGARRPRPEGARASRATASSRARDILSQDALDAAVAATSTRRARRSRSRRPRCSRRRPPLEDAQVKLGYTDIVSPVDGVVVSRTVDVGQTVAASFQTPTLFVIAEDLTKMQVNANVSESDIGGVAEGQSATFSVDAYPGPPLHGHGRAGAERAGRRCRTS